MPTKSQLVTVAWALVTLAVINNVSALDPIKKQLNGDTGWF